MQRNLGIALAQERRFGEAVDVFYRALAINPNDVSSHLHLSGALYRQERHDTALYHAEKALELAPESLDAHLYLGNAKASLGRMEEAETHLLKAAQVMPSGMVALIRLIHMRKTTPDSPEFKILEMMLERVGNFQEQRQSGLHMAAGKANADLGDYDASFQHLSIGNALTKKHHPFDLENHIGQVDRLTAVASQALVSSMRGQAGLNDIAPIFVCGMPRSGTTLVEQMLSRHSQVQAGGELQAARIAIGRARRLMDILEERDGGSVQTDDLNQIGEAYVAAIRNQGISSEILTDKMPINYMYVGLMSVALPRARFLIMRRHPMDCCLSNWEQDFGHNQPFSTDLRTLGQVYMQYRRITDYWAKLLPDRVRIVPYEDVVSNTETTMREALDFCGLPWEEDVLDHTSSKRAVNTASISQVRQPLYSSSVAKWRRYGPLLRPLAEEVTDLLTSEERAVAGLGA